MLATAIVAQTNQVLFVIELREYCDQSCSGSGAKLQTCNQLVTVCVYVCCLLSSLAPPRTAQQTILGLVLNTRLKVQSGHCLSRRRALQFVARRHSYLTLHSCAVDHCKWVPLIAKCLLLQQKQYFAKFYLARTFFSGQSVWHTKIDCHHANWSGREKDTFWIQFA